MAEFEHEFIHGRHPDGIGRCLRRRTDGGRKFAVTKVQIRLAKAAMKRRDTSVTDLTAEFGIVPVTLYRDIRCLYDTDTE